MLANVILATLMPYAMVAVFCFVVAPIETAIFLTLQRATVRFPTALWLVISANLVSWLAGIIITMFIPAPASFHTTESYPKYFAGIVIGFIVAFFLSWLIEYRYLKLFTRRFTFHRLSLTVCLANLASYVSVFLISWLLFG